MEDQLWQAISPEAKESWLHRFKRWSFHGSQYIFFSRFEQEERVFFLDVGLFKAHVVF